MSEYRYDNAGENARRIPLFVLAVAGLGFDALLGRSLGWHWLLLVGPVLMALYFYDLLRHYRHRDDRIEVEEDAVTIWEAGRCRQIERADIEFAYHTGALLHIKLKSQDPVQLPARFQNQEKLLSALSPPKG